MEASALRAPAAPCRPVAAAPSVRLLRLRSDAQLVSRFRAGDENAFRIIHDRYRTRLLAYARQMLGGARSDAEDVLQEVFVRAYAGLQADEREIALRAWLYRIAHNRCIDQLRRPVALVPVPDEQDEASAAGGRATDPAAAAEQHEALALLLRDIRRLPEQQRSALLLRELAGMSYGELAVALAVSVPAVKSLLVRARVGLVNAADARDTACEVIRSAIVDCHDRGIRPDATTRRHLRDCPGCRAFRGSVRGTSRRLSALVPGAGLAPLLAKALGGLLPGSTSGAPAGASGAGAGAGATAGGGATAGAGAGATAGGATAGGGALAVSGAGHVAAWLAVAVVTAGGAVGLQAGTVSHHRAHQSGARPAPAVARVGVRHRTVSSVSSTRAHLPSTGTSAAAMRTPSSSEPAEASAATIVPASRISRTRRSTATAHATGTSRRPVTPHTLPTLITPSGTSGTTGTGLGVGSTGTTGTTGTGDPAGTTGTGGAGVGDTGGGSGSTTPTGDTGSAGSGGAGTTGAGFLTSS